MNRRWARGAVVALALLAPGGRAGAQDGANAARAETLFQEGRRLMGEGKLAEACPMLAASQKLDPGAGTLMNLAACYEQSGRTASAWATWVEAANAADRDGRADWSAQAQKRAQALVPMLSRLVIEVPPQSDVPGLRIEREGVLVERVEWGTPVPVDPGAYPIVATAPQRQLWSTTVSVGPNGASVTVTVPSLVSEQKPTPASRAQPGAPSAPPVRDAGPAEAPAESSGWRMTGYVVGSVGLASLAAGGVFGWLAMSSHDRALEQCTNGLCTPEGLEQEERAHDRATVSTVAVLAGAVLAGGGAAMILLSPPGKGGVGVAATPVRAGAQLSVGGAF